MASYLLDTNIISDIVRNPQGQASQQFEAMASDPRITLATSIVVVCEIRYGLIKRGSIKLADRMNRFLESIEIMPLGVEVHEPYGRLRADLERRGTPIWLNDTLIAAHALALDAVLVTDNVGEFRRVTGLRVENWIRI